MDSEPIASRRQSESLGTPHLLRTKLVLPDDNDDEDDDDDDVKSSEPSDDKPPDHRDGNKNGAANFRIDGLSSLVALALEHHLPLLADGVTANESAITVRAGSGAFATVNVSRTSVDISSHAFSWYGEENLFGNDRPKGQKVAVKRVVQERGHGPGDYFADIVNEIRIIAHSSLRKHKNIVDAIGLSFTGSVHDDPRTDYRWPVLLLEFANCGTLQDFFSLRNIHFTWELKAKLAYDIVLALEALNDACVLHGDLKLTNVLVFKTGSNSFIAKLCDFGTAVISTDYDADMIYEIVYTPPWGAPEVMLGGVMIDDLYKVDLYSYGLLVCRLFTEGEDPFELNHLADPELSEGPRSMLISNWKQNDEAHNVCKKATRLTTRARFTNDQLHILDGIFDLTVRFDPDLRAEEHSEIKSILRPDLSQAEAEKRNKFDSNEIMSEIVPRIFAEDLTKCVPSVERLFGSLLPKNIAVEIIDDLKQIATIHSSSTLEMIKTQDRIAAAALELSHAFIQGLGCDNSYEKAASWLAQSAELGSRNAQNEMFRMFEAMEIPLPQSLENNLLEVTLQNAIAGSPSALEEWRKWDPTTFVRVKHDLRTKYGGMGIDIFTDVVRATYPLDDPSEFIQKISHANDKVVFDDDDGDGLTWLHYAASNGSAQAVHLMVQQDNCDVNCYSDDNKWTPLYMACNGGHYQVAQILLDKGADARAVSAAGRTPLHNLHMFDVEVIPDIAKRLHDAGADIEAPDSAGQTPLFLACIQEAKEAVIAAESLIEHGANPTSLSREGYSSIDITAINLRPQLLGILLSSRHITDDDGAESLIHLSAKALKNMINVPVFHRLRNGGALYRQKLPETLQVLISGKAVDAYIASTVQKLNPLQDAAIWGATDMIQPLCLFKELDINAFTATSEPVNLPPLFDALKFDNEKLMNAILDEGADITVRDQAGRNVLHFAVEFAPRFLALFLTKLTDAEHDVKAFINAGTKERNFTPLDVAVLSHRFREADTLIAHGAQYKELTRTGEAGELYSTLGLTGGSRRQMSYFLDMPPAQRPSPVVCNYGFTLFHITAASFDNALLETDPSPADNITFLLEHYFKAEDANRPDNAGNTPLHTAALFGNTAVAQTLLDRAVADVNARNKFGSTPLDRLDARKQGKDQAIKEQALVDDLEEHTWNRRNEEMERLLESRGGVRGAQLKRKR